MITKKEFIEMFNPMGERVNKDKILVVEGAPIENLKRAFDELMNQKDYNDKDAKKNMRKEDSMNIYLDSKRKKGKKKW